MQHSPGEKEESIAEAVERLSSTSKVLLLCDILSRCDEKPGGLEETLREFLHLFAAVFYLTPQRDVDISRRARSDTAKGILHALAVVRRREGKPNLGQDITPQRLVELMREVLDPVEDKVNEAMEDNSPSSGASS